MLDGRTRRRVGQRPYRRRTSQDQGRLEHQQRHGADTVGLRGRGDADDLADELQRRRQRHRPRQVTAGHGGQQRIARRHGKGADRTGCQAIGDQQRVAQHAHRQQAQQDQGRQGVEKVVAQQQAPGIAAIGDHAPQRQEQDARRHQRHLGQADGESIHVQHDSRQPGKQYLLDAKRDEPASQAREVDGKDGGTGAACFDWMSTISCNGLVPLAHPIVKIHRP